MALSDAIKKNVTELVTAVDAVGVVLPKLHYLKETLTAADYKTYINAVSAGTEAVAQTEIITKTYISSSYIDPFTAYNIFDQVLYPPIEAMSPGWSENPYNSDSQSANRDFYMRGVPLVDIFNPDGELKNLSYAFNIADLTNGPGYVDNAGLKPLKKVTTEYIKLANSILKTPDIANQKDLLRDLFGNAPMAKTYFVSTYLNDRISGANLQEPYRMIQVDPYLAYLTMLFAWLGGVGYVGKAALDRFKGTKNNKTLRDAIETAGNSNWHNIAKDNRPKTAEGAIDMLQIFYEYIQSIKLTNNDLYDNWMNMLVKDKKCMVNMLVIINERVNLNNGNTFAFQEKPKEFQLALAEAYKQFSMEIGD